jgi:asparagine synthase (glutamine-hydrolysing)
LALAHRRLAIIDVSPLGHQPMHSVGGRYVVAYNGEIYNFELIRSELEAERRAHNWRGHSDTEVLLAAVEAWGFEATLRRLVGMFAIALWDRETCTLSLAR